MMDIEKLIEQLSARGLSNGSSLGYHSGLFDEAATALSALQAENERLRGHINDLETQHRTEMCENGYDCVELGKLRAQNDALLTAMEAINNAAVGYLENGPYDDGERTSILFAQAAERLSRCFLAGLAAGLTDHYLPEGEEFT